MRIPVGSLGMQVWFYSDEVQDLAKSVSPRSALCHSTNMETSALSYRESYFEKFPTGVFLVYARVRTLVLSCVLTGLLFSGSLLAEPPYSGTVFLDPDIITSDDPSTFVEANYVGTGMRTMYDRRTGWVELDAYLFDAIYSDELRIEIQVNPEFGSVEAAAAEANFYGAAIGQIPYSLRTDVQTSWIHKGDELFGGGNNNILIHTGAFGQDYISRGFLEEVLIHEAVHTSLDADHANSEGWIAAQEADGEFISTYARDYPQREDLAESFVPYLAVLYKTDRISDEMRDTIISTIPNRIAYLDEQRFNMAPVALESNVVIPTSRGSLSGSWYDPTRNGEGFVFDFGSNPNSPVATVYWFTHRDSQPYWLIGISEYDEDSFNSSGLLEFQMLEVSGTGFGENFNSDDLQQFERGTLSLVVEGCSQVVASWSPEEGSDALGTDSLEYQLQRITLGLDGVSCSAGLGSSEMQTKNAVAVNGVMSGSWFDPARNGEGFVFEFGENPDSPVATTYWFTHRDGKPFWLIGIANYAEGQEVLNTELLEVSGTSFGADFDPDEIQTSVWGGASFNFLTCDDGAAAWTGPNDSEGGFDLRRITLGLDGAECALGAGEAAAE